MNNCGVSKVFFKHRLGGVIIENENASGVAALAPSEVDEMGRGHAHPVRCWSGTDDAP